MEMHINEVYTIQIHSFQGKYLTIKLAVKIDFALHVSRVHRAISTVSSTSLLVI